MSIYALIAGDPRWCARARARWPRGGVVALSGGAVALLEARDGASVGGLLTRPSAQGADAAWLYGHDGRFPGAVGRACEAALVGGEGAGAAPALGACSAVTWTPAGVEAQRDACGLSPLWYVVAPEGAAHGVAVASHPWLLRVLLDCPCEVNRAALAAFLLGEDDDSDGDFFAGLRRLRPGEGLRWWASDGRLVTRLRPAQGAQARGGDLDEWAAALGEALRAQCARVERPFAVALSGGVDSGLVAAASLQARPGERLRAVSMTSERWPEMDERFATAQWEAAAPVDVQGCCIDGFGPLTAAPLLRAHVDLGPQAHGGVAFLVGLARAAVASGHRLLLTGLGGDQALDLEDAEWLTSALWCGQWGAVARRWREGGWWPLYAAWARPWLSGSGWSEARRALGGRYLVRRAEHLERSPWRDARGWLTEGALGLSPQRELSGRMGWLYGWIWEDAIRHLSLCQLASGVRFAHPLLDAPALDVLARAPSALLMHPQPKALARHALRGQMPEPVRALPKIGGFCALMEQGIADRLDDTLTPLFSSPQLAALGLLQTDRFLDILRQYVAWTRRRDTPRVGYAHLWRTIAAELWLQSIAPPSTLPPWRTHDDPDPLRPPDATPRA